MFAVSVDVEPSQMEAGDTSGHDPALRHATRGMLGEVQAGDGENSYFTSLEQLQVGLEEEK